jgi:uncharacterized protein (DUF1499 family)
LKKNYYLAPAVAFAAALAMLASGFGYRFGLWNLNTAFAVLRAAAIAAVAGAVLSLITAAWAALRTQTYLLRASLAGFVAAAIAFAVPFTLLQLAKGLPQIHDVTTDPENPPQFIALRAERLASPNGLEYGGRHVVEAQRESYPDIVPLTYAAAPPEAFARCLEIARRLGWQIAEADAKNLRIEATDRTFFFGFRDDISIRITPVADARASRVDMRSDSRIGGGDFGANAKRLRRFFRALAEGG